MLLIGFFLIFCEVIYVYITTDNVFSVGIYNFLSIVSNSFINELKFPDGALYVVIIQACIEFRLNFKAQTSKSFSIQYVSRSIFSKFKLLCT